MTDTFKLKVASRDAKASITVVQEEQVYVASLDGKVVATDSDYCMLLYKLIDELELVDLQEVIPDACGYMDSHGVYHPCDYYQDICLHCLDDEQGMTTQFAEELGYHVCEDCYGVFVEKRQGYPYL